MKRRALALIVAFLMMVQPVAGFADDPVDLDGVVVVDDGLVEDGTLDLDGIALDDAGGLLGDGADVSLDLALVSNDVEPAPQPFEQTAVVDGVRFTMTAGPDTFPANAILSVSAVEDEATLQAVAQSVGTDGLHHVYAICLADETGAPLTPGAELPLVRVEGMNGDIRVFAYDQEAQRANEIETENGAFPFEKSGLYDIVEEAPAEGGEPAQPGEEAPAEGGEPAQPGEEAPADGGDPAQPGEEAPGDGGEPAQPGEEAPGDGGEPAQPGEEAPGDGGDPAQPGEEAPAGGLSIEIEGEESGNVDLLPDDIRNDLEGIGTDADILDGNPAEALLPFEQSRTVNGVVVTVKADPGVFPANAQLSVKRVPTYKKRETAAAIDEVRDEDQNVAVSYTFDIKVIDPETKEELQPAEGRTVSVSFALSEVADENLETNVYHIAEEKGELVAESLQVTTEDQETAVVETDGFSLYTVEFTYGDLEYVLPGDTSVAMGEILDALNLTGEVTAVEVSNASLFSASDATGAWVVTALRPFTSTEWMKVTINDIAYKITVTDAVNDKEKVSYINANGVTQETNATVLTENDNSWGVTSGTNGWYVVNTNLQPITETITVTGNVHLILKSPCQLTARKGIQVSVGSSLTIYADSTNPDNMGKLMVSADSASIDAGIGGGGNITINGGNVTASGKGGGAGIGGDGVSSGGIIVINGGIVTAFGENGGAGIGGGNSGAGGSITINGGQVTAYGVNNGSGIGPGKDYTGTESTTISINGGKVVTSGSEGISAGKNGDADILSVGPGLYVYNCENSDEKKWTPIDIIDGFYGRCAHMAVYNKVPNLVAQHTVGQKTYPYYNVNTPIDQFEKKGGTLKLYQNLKHSGTVMLGAHDGVDSFTLDLNGYGLIKESNDIAYVIAVLQGGFVELIDSDPARNHRYTLNNGKAEYIDSSGNESFKGGYITGGTEGGVHVVGTGQFTMSAGTIIGNETGGGGGGVMLDSQNAAFIMRGGSITRNRANLRQGSGVYVREGAFGLSGKPIIDGNYASNVYLEGSNRIDVTGALEKGASVRLTMQTEGVFTRDFDEYNTVDVEDPNTWPSVYFHSDATGVKVLRNVNGSVATDENEVKLGKHEHEYTCEAAKDDAGAQIISITCANSDCGHDGATRYTLGLTVPDSWVYGNIGEPASFLNANALEAFNKAFEGDTTKQVTAEKNLFFYNTVETDSGYVATGAALPASQMPAAAGHYVVELSVQAMDGSGTIKIAEPFAISPKELTITGLSAKDKTYDRSASATITGTAALQGVVGYDDVSLVLPSGDQAKAVFVDADGNPNPNAGKNKAVQYLAAEPFAISGSAASNYTLAQPTGLKAEITAKPVAVEWDTATPLIYNKQLQHPAVRVKDGDLIVGDSCDVIVIGGQIDAGENYKATATALTDTNYALSGSPAQPECSYSILPKSVNLVWGETSFTYDGKEHLPTVTVEAGDLIGDDRCDVTVTGGQTNAGKDYTATVTALSNVNYALPEEDLNAPSGTPKKLTRTFSIAPKTAELAWGSTSFVFDDQPHVPTASVKNLEKGDDCIVTVGGEETEIGQDYTATATKLDNTNYALPAENTTLFSIGEIVAELQWTNTSFIYDGEPHLPAVTVTNQLSGEPCTVTVVQGAKTNAGNNYTAEAMELSNRHYILPSKKTQTFTITPKTVGLTWTNTELTYNRQLQAPTATATGLVGNDQCTVTVTGSKTSVGSYEAKATRLSNANYALPADQSVLTTAFTIVPKTVILNWQNTSLTYNGAEQKPRAVVANLEGYDGCEVTVTVEGEHINANTYVAKATAVSNPNYALPKAAQQTDDSILTRSFTIYPKTVGLSWGNGVFVYDGNEHNPPVSPTGLVAGDTCTVIITGAAKAAGRHTAIASKLSNPNYALPTANTTRDFTINQKTVELAWGTSVFTYDGAAHVPAATAASLVQGDVCTVNVTGEKTNAGTYTATAESLSNPNYALPTARTQRFTIDKRTVGLTWADTSLAYNGKTQTPTATATGLIGKDVCTVTVTGGQRNVGSHTATASTLSNSNYILPKEVTQTFTISPLTAGLTWSNTSLAYNGKEQLPTVKATGLASGDSCTVILTGAHKDVGSYTATATGLSNGNYLLPKEVTQTFTIAKKAVGLSWANTSFTYDGGSHAPTATATGLISGDTCAVTVTGAAKDAGKYTATASALSNANYALPTANTRDFTIAQKTVGLQWGTSAFTYDGEAHMPTATATGLAQGDACGVTVTGAQTKVGSYTATASALSNPNYALPSAKTQKFTIDKKTVGLTWSNTSLAYNGKTQTPTATATGLIGKDVCTVTVTGGQRNVGSHTATAKSLSNGNYALPKEVTQAFTISPLTAGLTWSNTSLTYNGKEQLPTVKAAGLVSGDSSTVIVTGAQKDVGSYTATATGLSNGNYVLPKEATQAFTIAGKAVGLTWANTSFTYDGESHAPTATATGLMTGDECAVTVSGAAANAGTHTATATALSNGNYVLPEKHAQTFTIAQRAVTVTASDQTIKQGGSIKNNKATLSNAVSSHTLKSVKLAADTAKGVITPSGAVIVDANGKDVTANYKISYATGKLTVSEEGSEPADDPIDEFIKVDIDVKECKITVKNQTYTGKKLTPAVTVVFEKTKLKQGKDYKVSFKNNKDIGVATVTVYGKGDYTGSKKASFKILPPKTAFTKLTGGKQKITLKWKNRKNITGYQIQYSLKKSFSSKQTATIKKATTLATTISGLEAKKTYYVRIRTYKVVGKKTYYSAWSAAKAVKTQ